MKRKPRTTKRQRKADSRGMEAFLRALHERMSPMETAVAALEWPSPGMPGTIALKG